MSCIDLILVLKDFWYCFRCIAFPLDGRLKMKQAWLFVIFTWIYAMPFSILPFNNTWGRYVAGKLLYLFKVKYNCGCTLRCKASSCLHVLVIINCVFHFSLDKDYTVSSSETDVTVKLVEYYHYVVVFQDFKTSESHKTK